MQVTRDGKLRMQFLAPMLSSELVKNFKNESIRINLINDEKQEVKFKIENRDTLKSIITLRLSFQKPK
jgi:hypothetical protein